MTNIKDIILKLKDVRDEKGLSYNEEQVAYKDKRMDMLLEAVFEKDKITRKCWINS